MKIDTSIFRKSVDKIRHVSPSIWKYSGRAGQNFVKIGEN